MANKNQVTLTFAGDHDRLTKSFDEIGSSAKGMGTDVGQAGQSFDRVGEATDALDTKAMGFRDTITGVQDSVVGFGKVLKGDFSGEALFTAGAGVGDLASGFTNLLVPSLASAVGWLAKTKVGMLAQAAASKVVAGATKVWTGVQWLLNAALTANPIGLVVVAIAALVAGIVIAYNRSETFRKIVKGAFEAVGKAVSWLGDRFGGLFVRLRDTFARVTGIITAPFRSAFNFVARAWNNTIGRLSWSVPSWVPVIGGNTISAPTLPTFHTGGIASGSMGREFLAVLRAGERVTPTGGGAAAMRLSVERGDGGTDVEQGVVDLILYLVHTGALALHVREGAVVV